jgi:hypothetical protein
VAADRRTRFYCYKIGNDKVNYIGRVGELDSSIGWGTPPTLYPLSKDGHFLAVDNGVIYQFAPNPGPEKEAIFRENATSAEGEQIFPIKMDDGKYRIMDDGHVFIYDNGWKVIKMPEPEYRDPARLKQRLIQVADKAERGV